MNRLFLSSLVGLTVLFYVIAAGGQEIPADGPYEASSTLILSESEAVAAAVDASPELKRLNRRVKARRTGADYARFDIRNPEVRIQDISTRYSNPEANHRIQLGLRWRLPRFGEVNENVAQANWEYEQARVDAFVYRMKLVGKVWFACNDIASLKDELDLAVRREKKVSRRFEVLSRLLELGTVPFSRKMKAQTFVLRARRIVAQKRNALAAAKARLGSLVGHDRKVDVVADPLPEGEICLDEILVRARGLRPEHTFEASRLELARARRKAERLKMVPSFSFVEAVYHYERKDPDWGELMVGIEIPVFNWGRGKLKKAEIMTQSREISINAGFEEVRQKISEAYRQAAEARAGYLILKEQMAETREDVERTVEMARGQGMPEDEVLDLELSGIDLEEMLLMAARTYREALIDLCVAAGVENINDIFDS